MDIPGSEDTILVYILRINPPLPGSYELLLTAQQKLDIHPGTAVIVQARPLANDSSILQVESIQLAVITTTSTRGRLLEENAASMRASASAFSAATDDMVVRGRSKGVAGDLPGSPNWRVVTQMPVLIMLAAICNSPVVSSTQVGEILFPAVSVALRCLVL